MISGSFAKNDLQLKASYDTYVYMCVCVCVCTSYHRHITDTYVYIKSSHHIPTSSQTHTWYDAHIRVCEDVDTWCEDSMYTYVYVMCLCLCGVFVCVMCLMCLCQTEVIFHRRALWLAALLQKITCNLRHPTGLLHPVWHSISCMMYVMCVMFLCLCDVSLRVSVYVCLCLCVSVSLRCQRSECANQREYAKM